MTAGFLVLVALVAACAAGALVGILLSAGPLDYTRRMMRGREAQRRIYEGRNND